MRRTRNSKADTLFDTGMIEVISDDPTNDVMNPITQVFRAIDLKDMNFDVWIGARTDCQGRLGVEFSDNPVDFTGAVQKELAATYLSNPGWNFGSTWVDIWNLSGLANADYKMYARIVARVKTGVGKTTLQSMILRVRAQQKPIRPRTLVTPWVLVNSFGTTGTACIHPCTGAIPADGVAVHRVMLEVVKWQETNTPDDVTSWGGGATLASGITGNGVTYPGKVTSVTPTKRFMRYVVDVTHAGSTVEGARVRLTIDQRDR
jgi:hypothetical protein